MALHITSLNSGSNGNCYYIGNNEDAILIDAGISCRETEKRLKRLQLSIQRIKAIFISHEHSDHIRGVEVLHRKYKLPVYITDATRSGGCLSLDTNLTRTFRASDTINIGNLSVKAFPKLHDACDPFSFVIGYRHLRVGVFTDIGRACEQVKHHFHQCHAAFLEANYDEEMLENGSYPYHLKRRIRGDKGHLSNMQALALFQQHRPSFMSHLFLSHLSENNNCPDRVSNLFNQHAGSTKIIIASRYEETPVYLIASEAESPKRVFSQLQFAFA
ncbi:MAG TPA: MBL fold metallo-hydrolase [Flavitalea sp.]|nr:MBL fold metallo-hydrolase [Flavitalea sp.]